MFGPQLVLTKGHDLSRCFLCWNWHEEGGFYLMKLQAALLPPFMFFKKAFVVVVVVVVPFPTWPCLTGKK